MKLGAGVAAALLLLAGFALAESPATAITGGTVVNGIGAPLAEAVVIVRGDRIREVGPVGKVRVPRGATRVDARGKWIIPGLIDGHVHFFQSGGLYTRPDIVDLRDLVPYEAAEVRRIRSRLADTFARYLRCGITAVADVGGPFWNFEVREIARKTALAPRVAVAGPLVSTIAREALGSGDPPIIQAKSAEEAVALVRRQAGNKPDILKIWYPVPPGETPEQHYPMVSAAIAEAHRLGIRAAVHATELPVAKAAVRAGADILVHSVFDGDIDDELIGMLKTRRVIYTPTLVVYEGYQEVLRQRVNLSPAELRWADPYVVGTLFDLQHLPREVVPPFVLKAIEASKPVEPAAAALRNLKRLVDAGVTVAAGTDAGNIGTLHGPALFREFELMSQAGLTPQQILAAATRNGAELVGMAEDLGMIEKGRLADLVILDADPLADIRHVARIHAVMKGGVLYAAAGILRPTPEDVVQRQVNAYNARDIDAFLETYHPEAQLFDYPGTLRTSGTDQMRQVYGRLFTREPRLHVEIARRISAGPYVIDEERVTGLQAGTTLEAVAIYRVEDGLIRTAHFIFKGAP